jgi:Tfp pilus assembly protein PilF
VNLKHRVVASVRTLLSYACLSMLILSVPAATENPKLDGLAALKQGDFQRSHDLLLQAVEGAKNGSNKKETADLLFYLGLGRQQVAQQLGEGETRAGLLAEAAMYYNQALGLNPQSSSILNNLAQIYSSQGASGLAQETLSKTIALDDTNQAFHMQNYADLLLSSKGDWKDASRFYALALWKQPDNPALLEKLVNVCLNNDRDLLGSYLWDMTVRGQVLQAQEVALNALLRPIEWTRAQKEELLTIVAVCLSKQTYNPREFAKSGAAKRLQKLYEDTAVGAGARGLIQLHEVNELHSQDFEWWRTKVALFRNPHRGKWPLQAFQDLIRSTGEYYKTDGQLEIAARYLRLAVDIYQLGPDIPSLVALADLYARTGQQHELRDLIRAKEDILFGAKARAYQEHKLNDIYALHRALGSIYSYLGQWGQSADPASAIFQLEHALNIAREAEREPTGKPIEVEPDLVDRLATAYQKTDQPVKAFQVRLAAAEDFQKSNNNEAATAVFAPIQRSTPPKDLMTRYEAIKQKLENDSGSATIAKPEVPKFHVRVSVKSQSVEDQQQEQRLSEKEVGELRKSLTDLLKKEPSKVSGSRTIQLLPPKGIPEGVKEIDVEGGHGRVVLEKDAKGVEVPFTVDTVTPQAALATRYIKP